MPDPNLLLGFDTADDAAVWQVDKDNAAVLTLDFFTPVVDDPYEFGAVAAANGIAIMPMNSPVGMPNRL